MKIIHAGTTVQAVVVADVQEHNIRVKIYPHLEDSVLARVNKVRLVLEGDGTVKVTASGQQVRKNGIVGERQRDLYLLRASQLPEHIYDEIRDAADETLRAALNG